MSRLREMIKELCPDGVEYRKLGEILSRHKGIAITAGKMKELHTPDGEIRIFAAGNTYADVMESDVDRGGIIREPAIIVKSRGNIGFEYYTKPFSHKNEMWSYTTNHEFISLKYVYYVLEQNMAYFQNKAKTGKLPQISISDTENYEILVPPLPIQNEIVKLLDNFTELTAELTAELLLRKKQYNFYRDSLLKFPSNTKRYKTGDIFNIQNGYTPSKKQSSYWEHGTIPWYRMEDIRANGRILYDAIQHVHYSGVKGNLYPEKSILMATTATIGEYALLMTSSLSNQQMTNFSIKKEFKELLDVKFAFYYFHVFAEWCKKNANQSGGMPIITTAKLKTFSFPIPPLDVQQKIVSILDRFDALCNDLTQGLPAEIAARKKQYEYYRDKLLAFQQK